MLVSLLDHVLEGIVDLSGPFVPQAAACEPYMFLHLWERYSDESLQPVLLYGNFPAPIIASTERADRARYTDRMYYSTSMLRSIPE